ncbi:MAG: hypothetical protein ABW061_04470, partial [Polyangiaceae bacterium]
PHYAVLYNLGQAYAALGKSVEAARAFELYLEGGGQKLAPERQAEVRQLILLSKKRVGYVAFEIEPSAAKLLIDGRAIDAASLHVPTSLTVGVHGVALTLTGFQTFVGSVNVESQKITALKIKLQPAAAGVPTAAVDRVPVGQVAVDSALPELKVLLDDVAIERVGKDPFLTAVGRHRIRCQRDGYDPIDVQIDVIEKGVVRVACDLTPASHLQPSDAGFVSFNIDQPGAQVLIDGRRVSSNVRLPQGLHAARIRRSGFIDWTRAITVRPGFPETIEVQLKPTPEHGLELAQAASERRTYAYVIGGAGIALLGTSAVLYATNNDRYHTWSVQRDGVSRDIQAQNYSPDLSARAADVRRTAVSIQRQDDAALGVAVVGGVLLGYAVISWLGSR